MVYILSDNHNKTIYVDMIKNDTIKYILNSNYLFDGFTADNKLNKIVYYESSSDLAIAIAREKEIKNLSRDKKKKLIEENNPGWNNLMNKLK